MTTRINFHKTRFLISAPDIAHLEQHLPQSSAIEIAFAGRSNAGKSSALNALTDQKSLARTSKTPGRTQLINVFAVDEWRRLVDLPGYGFAQVPQAMKLKWQQALAEYLQHRECLGGVVVLMDIRHPLKDMDRQMVEWSVASELPVLVLLTKADKLPQSARMKTVNEVRSALKALQGDVIVEPFSALKGTGKEKVLSILDNWSHPQWLLDAINSSSPSE
ncbi:ribosome biogenesis GTP-binding protein YihA/YsxC [Shewanella fodinae]|uniref:ribosome biogenesis GTP-binding protein YihA/YsxC n=1 Tax=Shewanella fodinae TaxID=552357 RepID=UPI00167A4BF9|nr:ribosome biogenesis GTP-binding protein YihA/YsxC [Shewanella fodinae]MCL2908160.1 ribosome biogenesis GTP-binding protein YihA/YsxC [Shewanella fodinae]GGZ13776.1 putative GTP-binding protein EngB [Shewanella fodinae]